VTTSPNPLVRGQNGTIYYEDEGGPIAGASAVNIHYGFDTWLSTTIADASMTFNSGTGKWEVTLALPAERIRFDCVFNNGAGVWDNNNSQDWHFDLVLVPTPQPTLSPTPSPSPTAAPSPTPSPVPTAPPAVAVRPVLHVELILAQQAPANSGVTYEYRWTSSGANDPAAIVHTKSDAAAGFDEDTLRNGDEGASLDPGETWHVVVTPFAQGTVAGASSTGTFIIDANGAIHFSGWVAR